MGRNLVLADGERVSMAREDVAEGSAAMTGLWCGREVTPGLETGTGISGGRGLTTHCIKSFYYVGTNNRISTSGTCKFARDGPGPSYAIRPFSTTEMDMGLHFYYMTVSSPFSVLTPPSTAPLGHVHHIAELLKSSHDTTVAPITFTIDRLPAHQREVKITTVTPALDEFYRFHTVIREQIGQQICHTRFGTDPQ
ncbi:hypothetical protein BU17DRAFT_60070 [Hysterangium stoloniferum]|nr:hypothetical protein BU17DRAFT_60070 [Hysterangium stoloniferum]